MAKWHVVLPVFALVFPGLGQSAGAASPRPAEPFAIENVTVLDGTGGAGREGATVLVRAGRIEAVLGSSRGLQPSLRRINGKDGFLLPGFIDMHAHLLVPRCAATPSGAVVFDRKLSERMLGRLLDFGITTVRSPATPTIAGMALRDDLNAGRVRGPRAQASAELINDASLEPAALRAHVREQLGHRPDYLKVYASLPPESVALVVDEAHARGVPVIGHMGVTDWNRALELRVDHLTHATDWSAAWLPADRRDRYLAAVRTRGALRARIDWLEHLKPDSPEVAAILARVAEAGASVDPTLVAYDGKYSGPGAARYRRNRYLGAIPELPSDWQACSDATRGWTASDYGRWREAWPKMLALVAQMHRRGVLLTTGSDLTNPWVIPGEALHQEFELLRQAGLPPLAILRMTGWNAARAMRRVDVGLVEAGRRADLVLLSADPRVDIANTRRIVWTMKEGSVVSQGPDAKRAFAPSRAGAELARERRD